MLRTVKELAKKLWANDFVRRVVHTAWQAAAGVLVSGVLTAHSAADVKALVIVAVAAALSAAKGAIVAKVQGK
jgi:hypothetical protein